MIFKHTAIDTGTACQIIIFIMILLTLMNPTIILGFSIWCVYQMRHTNTSLQYAYENMAAHHKYRRKEYLFTHTSNYIRLIKMFDAPQISHHPLRIDETHSDVWMARFCANWAGFQWKREWFLHLAQNLIRIEFRCDIGRILSGSVFQQRSSRGQWFHFSIVFAVLSFGHHNK